MEYRAVFRRCAALLLVGMLAASQVPDAVRAQPLEVPADTVVPTEIVDGLAVGRTQGAGGVTSDGAAQYTIPLWVPPGRAGIQPDLSLIYNSRSGAGSVGVGWGLSGFPRITRCRRTWLQDEDAREVRFVEGDDGDRFCLDGQRLVAVGGPDGPVSVYGGDRTEYRTEYNGQAKIVSHAPDELGPTYFTVYLKDGRIMTLGGAGGSNLEGQRVRATSEFKYRGPPDPGHWEFKHEYSQRVRLSWALARLEDRAGNYLTIDYTIDDAGYAYEQLPEAIRYTAFDGDPPLDATRSVHFLYEARPDAAEGFVGGFRTKSTKRLKRIEMRWASAPPASMLLRSFDLRYLEAGSGRSLLASVQECDGSAVCQPPTRFEWSSWSPDFNEVDTQYAVPRGALPGGARPLYTGDIDGDGRDDVASGCGKYWHSTGNGFAETSMSCERPDYGRWGGLDQNCAPYDLPEGILVDLNGDGRADFIEPTWVGGEFGCGGGLRESERVRWKHQIYLSTPKGFQAVEDDADRFYDELEPAYALDIDGDGLPEVLKRFFKPSEIGRKWGATQISDGTLRVYTELPYDPPLPTGWTTPDPNALALDVNGSGRLSLLVRDSWTEFNALSLEMDGPVLQPTELPDRGFCDRIFLDVNGDGLADWVSKNLAGSGGAEPGFLNVSLNTGHDFGFAEPAKWHIPPPFDTSPSLLKCPEITDGRRTDTGMRVVDYNGDGRQDLLLMAGYAPGPSAKPNLLVLESTGSGFEPRPLSIPAGEPTGLAWKDPQILDANGDGLEDFVQVVGGRLHLYTRKGLRGDLLIRVTDGFEAFEEFEYRPISEHAVYTPGEDCTYPRSCVKEALWVVSQHRIDAGDTEPRAVAYSYRDGRADAAGRGWLGFAERTATELSTSATTRVAYDNQTRTGTFYPCAGLAQSATTSVPLGSVRSVPSSVPLTAETLMRGIYEGLATGRFEIAPAPRPTRVASLTRDHRTTATCRVVLQGDGRTYFAYQDSVESSEYDVVSVPPPAAWQRLNLLRRESVRRTLDDYGNVTHEQSLVYAVKGGQPTGRAHKLATKVIYDNFPASWIVGQPMRIEQTSATRSGRSVTQVTEHEYHPDTGLLWKTRVEPEAPASDGSDLRLEVTLERDAYGLISAVKRAGSGEMRTDVLEYDDGVHTFLKAVTNAAGHTIDLAYHPGLGVLAADRDANGLHTHYRYDGFGRLRFVDAPDGGDAEQHYNRDVTGRPQVRTWPGGGAAVEVSYDRLGREVARRWAGFDGTWMSTETAYDSLGRIGSISLPHSPAAPPTLQSFEYDNLDRVLNVRHPEGHQRRAYASVETHAWDEKGNHSFVVEDELGRVAKSVHVDEAGREIATRFDYGPFGVLEGVTDAYGRRISIEYDRLGRRQTLVDLDADVHVAHYNAFGEVKDETDGNGSPTNYTRDLLGRVQTITSEDGVTRLTWDTAARGVGMLAESVSPDGVITAYKYDSLSRPEQIAWTIAGEVYAIDYTYDGFGRVDTLAYPEVPGRQRLALRYVYTPTGDLEKVEDAGSQHPYWQALSRDAEGRLTSERLGNGVTTTRAYGPLGQTRYIDSQTPSGPLLQHLEYEYEANGNLRRRFDNVAKTREQFGYDTLDRLTSWEVIQDGTTAVTGYRYDDVGNLLIRTDPPGLGAGAAYTYGERGAGPHALTSVTSGAAVSSYSYDAAGRQTMGPGRDIDYTAFDLPSRIRNAGVETTIAYDATQARALKRTAQDEYTVYVGGLYERRVAGGRTTYVFNVVAPERTVAQILWNKRLGLFWRERVLYLHDDRLGSTEAVSDASATLVEHVRYEPYGTRRDPGQLASPASLPYGDVRYGFTGHEHDDPHLVNMGGRIYDAQLGRFLSPDPIIGDPIDGQSYNSYSYVLNNPLLFTDPTGFQGIQTHDFPPDTITGRVYGYGRGPMMSGPVFSPPAPTPSPESGPGGYTSPSAPWTTPPPQQGPTPSPVAADDRGTHEVTTPPPSGGEVKSWIPLNVRVTTSTETYGRQNVDPVVGMGKVTASAAEAVAAISGLRPAIETVTGGAARRIGLRTRPELALKPEFDLTKPQATLKEMIEGIRQLEVGLKQSAGIGQALPASHVLTALQRRALAENVRRVITRTIPAVKAGADRQALQNQLANPRFRFLGQIPEAKAALIRALEGTGISLPPGL